MVTRLKLVLMTLFAVGSAPALSQTVAPGFTSTQLPRNDDNFTGAVNLGFSANYFGTTYSQVYVSNNGYVTFGGGQGTYTPVGLGAGYSGRPIIAAFYGDVDTRGAASGITSYGIGTYAGQSAFGVTWPGVGYYGSHTDKLNTFQLLLTNRSDTGAGNFDIYFNYNQIQWETGDASGGSNGFGGTPAAVGFNAGQGGAAGTFYEQPGSRVSRSFIDSGTMPLIRSTNDNNPGQLYFQVRNGGVIIPTPTGAVPEPATWGMMLLGFGAMGFAMRRRAKVRTNISFA